MTAEPLLEEGAPCPDEGCTGILEHEKVENCSCHIAAPCYNCENAGFECTDCHEVFHND